MRRSIVIRVGIAGIAATVGAGMALGDPPAAAPMLPPPAALAPVVVVASVNGQDIRLDQVDAYIRDRLAVIPLTTAQLKQLRTEIASEMVDDLLLKQFLAKNAPKVEPAEIDQHVEAFTRSLAKQGKTFAQFLKETNQTEAAVREAWTVALQLSEYVRQHVTEDQLKQYYAANKDYFDRVEVKASHIVIRVGPRTPPGERAAAKAKLQALRAEIVAGRLDFAAAAKKYSQCPTAPQGGDLGYLPRKGGLFDEAVLRAAFALKVGEVSDVVEAEFGVHLVKATDRKPGTPSEFGKCIEDVRDAYAEDYRAGLVAKLRRETRVPITVP
jgi:peptidyl-prolyl cis-trans isomerase C